MNVRATILALATLVALPLAARAQAPSPDAPETDEAESDAPATRLGPVQLETDHSTVRLGFNTQIRANVQGDGADRSSRLQLHRARPQLRVSLLDGRVRFRVHADLAPRALELLDLWVEGDVGSNLTLRAGIAKIPFSLHWDQGFMQLSVVDWPLTERWFGGGRQLGVTLASRPPTGWRWALGLYQGQTLRAANGQRFTTAYGEDRTNYLDLQEYTPLGTPHPELVGRLAHRTDQAGLETAVALSVAWDMRPTYAIDETLRVGLDGRIAFGPLTAWAGAFVAAAEQGDGDLMLTHGGSLVEVEVRPHSRIGIAARHSAIVRSDALRRDARARADEVIANGDPDQRAELEARYVAVDRIRAQHETTIGLNVYLVGDDLKLQLDGSWLRTAGPDDDAWRVRAQLGVGF